VPLPMRVLTGFRALFRKSRAEEELDAELRAYLESSIDEKMRAGMAREDAIRAARVELGSVEGVKDRVRDVGWDSVLESFWRDVRYGVRMLRRSPGFTAVAIAMLALGIGANTAIFSLINTLMLRTLPVRDPSALVQLLSRYPGEPRNGGFSWKVYEHFRDQNHVFSDLIAFSRPSPFQLAHEGLAPEMVDGHYVTGNFFPGLGVHPALGRLIGPEDDQPGSAGASVAVVSWSYWQNRLGGDPAAVGTRMVVDGVPATIVGVAPQGFFGIQVGWVQDVWLPVAMEPMLRQSSGRESGQLAVGLIARLRPGISIEQARAEMRVLDRWRIEEIARASNNPAWRHATIEVAPAGAGLTTLRDHVATPLVVLMAVVGLLLLLTCANVASMLLARAAARQREMALRASLGAGRARLLRQLLTESLLLAVAGGLLGVVLAYFVAGMLARFMTSGRAFPGVPPLVIHPALDLQVLLFMASVAVLAGVLFGLAPAWHVFSSAPMTSLRELAPAGETRSRRLLGKSLVVVQVALSVIVLSVATLFLRHLSNLRNVDTGFNRESVLLVTLDPARSGLEPVQLSALYRELLARLEALPGVRSATNSGMTPISGAGASRFVNVQGFREEPDARRYVSLNWIGPNYFATFGTPIVAGRDFDFADAGHPPVAIVNQAMARYYFGDRSPLGRQFTFDGTATPYEIVGVVGDAKYSDLHARAPRTIYLNAFQDAPGRSHQFALRTDVPPFAVAGEVRRAVVDVLNTVPIAKVTTLSDQVDASIVPERLMAMLSGLFGVLAASLAAIGLYGLLAYTVTRRTNEIGVRMALGATERDMTTMVLKAALGLVCAGLLVGAPLAVWSGSLARRLMDGLPAGTAFPIVLATLSIVAAALLAAYIPARRAAHVDPVVALRTG
jgi:predicted permease